MRNRTPKGPKKVALTVVALIALGAIGFGIQRAYSSNRHTPVAATPTSSAPTSPAPRPTVPIHRPAVKLLPHETVPSAAPTSFEMKGASFNIKAGVCQMENVRPLDPPGDQLHTVCWVREGFGVAPGSKSGGTSYILGHAWAQQRLVFNPLAEFAMKKVNLNTPRLQNGVPTYPVAGLRPYKIILKTPGGILTYDVKSAFAVRKQRAADVKSTMANIPNRVVLITCGVANGQDVDYNIIVDAYLESSIAS